MIYPKQIGNITQYGPRVRVEKNIRPELDGNYKFRAYELVDCEPHVDERGLSLEGTYRHPVIKDSAGFPAITNSSQIWVPICDHDNEEVVHKIAARHAKVKYG